MEKSDIVEHYEEMIAAGGSVYFDPVELSEVFHYYVENGTTEQLEGVLALSKELHPDDYIIKQLEAEYLLNTGDAGEALRLLDTIFDESQPYHCILRSAALAKLGMSAQALEYARLAQQDEDPDEYISYDLGLGFMNADMFTIALSYYNRSLAAHPDDVRTLSGILFCKTQLGDTDGLEELADKIIRLDPFHYEAWITKGNVKAAEKNYAEAYDAFDYAIAISPDDTDAYVHKARVKDEEDHKEEALELLSEAESRADNEQKAGILVMKAYVLHFLKRDKEAQQAVWNSLECVSLTPQVFLRAAYCFRDLGASPEEVTMLKAADEKEPDNEEVLNLLGEAYNDCGLFEEAAGVYERLCKLHPTPSLYALWGSCELSLGNYQKAYKLFADSNKPEPMWQSYILMTACDIEMSRFNKMEDDFRMAYSLNPDGAVELLEKIAPDMIKQMRENGFLKDLQQRREKNVRKLEKELLKISLKREEEKNKRSKDDEEK